MNILFLDFDGVLDTATYDFILIRDGKSSCDRKGRPVFDPRCVLNLESIIKATEAKIVVTSSWREIDSLTELRNMWIERKMPGEILDVTTIIGGGKQRGDEIDQWLISNGQRDTKYLIINDLPIECFNPHHSNHFVPINPINGIMSEDVITAISLFQDLD